jgi:hypothetical protein
VRYELSSPGGKDHALDSSSTADEQGLRGPTRGSNCLDISSYSNHWEGLLGWRVGKGPKIDQSIRVPIWIKENRRFTIACLRGLIETDGSIYRDRGYPMVMFKSASAGLAEDVHVMITSLGFKPHTYEITRHKTKWNRRPIFQVRLSKNVAQFLTIVRPRKS